MNKLSSIKVVTEDSQVQRATTGNCLPLLNEVRHALESLINTDTSTAIDLRSIPLAPGEEEYIEQALGMGEVVAQLSALGFSDIYESRFPGVWLVIHYNSDNEIMGKLIEITWIPSILRTQMEDARQGLAKLVDQMDSALASTSDFNTHVCNQ